MKNIKESVVECVTAAGESVEGQLVRLGRFDAVFSVSSCFDQLQTSEVLPSLKITSDKRLLYEGRATIHSLVDADTGLICEVALDESGVALEMFPAIETEGFDNFLRQWVAAGQISASFKIAVADMAILLSDLRSWMNKVEVAFLALPLAEAARREREFLARVLPRIIDAVNAQHEHFEEEGARIPVAKRPVYQSHAAREWGAYFLCAPFGHRTYHKPLGYAGDYEMMNMIHRNAPEGPSLFARAMHQLLVSQWPAASVRNRIAHLSGTLVEEVARVVRSGRRARIMNLGCGPAREVQMFMEQSPLSDHADFTLLDFNEDTIRYTAGQLEAVRRRTGRRTGVEMRQMSVHQVLRSAVSQTQKGALAETYDLVYCAGLFDYLADATCRALVKVFHQQTVPGGLVLVANMHDAKPFRCFIEFILDWHLIYRSTQGMWKLCPPELMEQAQVIAEPTTVNLFLQVRHSH